MTAKKILKEIESKISEYRKLTKGSSVSTDDLIEDIYELICEEFWGRFFGRNY
jgi:hypothetical protein